MVMKNSLSPLCEKCAAALKIIRGRGIQQKKISVSKQRLKKTSKSIRRLRNKEMLAI